MLTPYLADITNPPPNSPSAAPPSALPRTLRTAGGQDRAACCRRPSDAPRGTAPTWSTPRTRRDFPRSCATHKACDPRLRAPSANELHEARHLVEMAVARDPDLLERGL